MGVAPLVAAIWASAPGVRRLKSRTSVLRGEWLVERSRAEAFAAARETMRAMGLRVQREDQPAGLLVTRQRPMIATGRTRARLT